MVITNYKKLFITIIALVILFYSGYKILLWAKENGATKVQSTEFQTQAIITDENQAKEMNLISEEENLGVFAVNFDYLKEKNPDTVGWIKIDGTNIDYPVVKGKNNDFYLNHSFDKSPNGVGWVFADYRGDGTMFGTLKNILKKEWYDNNTTITYADESGVYNYKIFSIYRIEKEDYYITTGFQNKTEYKQFLDTLKSRSIKNFGVELTEKGKILTLSTCANDNRYRVVLHAKVEKVPASE